MKFKNIGHISLKYIFVFNLHFYRMKRILINIIVYYFNATQAIKTS